MSVQFFVFFLLKLSKLTFVQSIDVFSSVNVLFVSHASQNMMHLKIVSIFHCYKPTRLKFDRQYVYN